jgi:hypothetical protein
LEGLDYQALAKQTSYDFDTVPRSHVSSQSEVNTLVKDLKLKLLEPATAARVDTAIDDGNLDSQYNHYLEKNG